MRADGSLLPRARIWTSNHFGQFTWAAAVAVCLIVATGAAVRLTGSGLGCPDWPSCFSHYLTPPLHFHADVEFGNRLVTIGLVIVVGVTYIATLLARRSRRDLCWLAGSLILGVVAQAVLGGLVVYSKLNPYLVMIHFLASMALIVVAVILVLRGATDQPNLRFTLPRSLALLRNSMLVVFAFVLAAGTATTGAGPHAGSSQGQEVAKRLPVALRDMAELHSTLAMLLVGLTLAFVLALHALDVPEALRRRGRILMIVLVAQAAVGYTQYFTHLPVALVEIHVIGATSLVVGFSALAAFSENRSSPVAVTAPVPVDALAG